MLSNGGFSRFEELLQHTNFLPQLSNERVSVGVVDGHGVNNFLGPLDISFRPECGTVAGRVEEDFMSGGKSGAPQQSRLVDDRPTTAVFSS